MFENGMSVRLILFFLMFSVTPVQAIEPAPQRIITLSPHLAEIVTLIGAGDQLLGVAEYSDYPEKVKKVQRIGGATGLDIERILTIKPDLVLAWQGGTRESFIQQLEKLGMRVEVIKSETLEDIPASIKIIGNLLNKQQKAASHIVDFNAHLQRITEKYKNSPGRRIFIEVSSQPFMGLTNREPFGAGLSLCNLENIFSDIDKAVIITDIESVLSRKVDTVLLRQKSVNNNDADRKKFYRVSGNTKINFVGFDEDAAFRQTPRLLNAIEQVCQNVQGF